MRIVGCLLLLLPVIMAQEQTAIDLLQRAIAAHTRGDLATASKYYRLVLEKRPDLLKARLNLGAALAEVGQIDQAISVLEASPAKDRDNPEIRFNLALAYHRKGDLPAAIGELEKLPASQMSDARRVSLLADCYLRSRAPEKALSILQPAARARPADGDLAYLVGMALVRSGRADESLEFLERAGKLGNSADAWLLAGATALDLGQFRRAKDDLENALRLNPGIPGVWTWTGMARDRVSDEDGAEEAFRKALEANPQDFEANLHLGAILYRERELGAAKPYLERAVRLQPASTLALYAIALVRSGTGDTEGSVKDLESVVRAAPDWVEPHVKLASLYYQLHRDADGEKESAVVNRLKAEKREQKVSFPALEGP